MNTEKTFEYKSTEIFTEKDFPFLVMNVIHPASFATHTHEFIEMAYVRSGQGIHKLRRASSGQSISCGIVCGDIFILRPGDMHSFISCSGLKMYNILFMPEMIADCADIIWSLPGFKTFEEGNLHLSTETRRHIESVCERLILELAKKENAYKLLGKSLLRDILISAGRAEYRLHDRKNGDNEGERLFSQQIVNKAICLIEENTGNILTVEDLSSRLEISSSHLTRLFKQSTGLPPCEYMIRIRLEKAKDLLRTEKLPVGDIAYLSGFCDASYMSKLFKKLEGCTPNEYRKSLIPPE